jgi:hypothetical protein
MMKGYKAGQQIEVEVYNFTERKSEWVLGIFIRKCSASDLPFRYSVEINGIILDGFQAAHPDCVRPVKGR